MTNTREENAAELAHEEAIAEIAKTVQTRDVGLAIRDFLEGNEFAVFHDDDDTGARVEVDFVDVSDANNPIIHLSNGRLFRCVILAA